jgi:transglutaminase-like putative cysteine protease
VIYDVRQSTTYVYASPVAHARHVLRQVPINRDGQRVHVAALQIGPEPQHRREGVDFFGNRLTWIDVEAPHPTLAVKLTARVSVDPLTAPDPLTTPAWETIREETFATREIGPTSPAHFVFRSRMVSLDPEISDYAQQSFAPGRPILDGAIELMHRLNTDMTYEIGATTVTTTPPMSFALRRGVCQDFAHIMLACLRSRGLSARYVSGYLRTYPPAGADPVLLGADASHAWVSVFCPPFGWVDLDPTNDVRVATDHIVIAFGRDFGDVSPLRGVIVGGGKHRLSVRVSVQPE